MVHECFIGKKGNTVARHGKIILFPKNFGLYKGKVFIKDEDLEEMEKFFVAKKATKVKYERVIPNGFYDIKGYYSGNPEYSEISEKIFRETGEYRVSAIIGEKAYHFIGGHSAQYNVYSVVND